MPATQPAPKRDAASDDDAWRSKATPLSVVALCDELLQVHARMLDGAGPAAPSVTITLGSGLSLTGFIRAKSATGEILVEDDDGFHTVVLDRIECLTLPHTAAAREVLTLGRVEAAPEAGVPTRARLDELASGWASLVGVRISFDSDLRMDSATHIGASRLLAEVGSMLETIASTRGRDVLPARLDEIWIGRGGRAGAFLSKRRLEVRARLEDGRAGRMARDELMQAIEAVL